MRSRNVFTLGLATLIMTQAGGGDALARPRAVTLLTRAVVENGAIVLAVNSTKGLPKLRLLERRRARWLPVPLRLQRWLGERQSGKDRRKASRSVYLLLHHRQGRFRRGATYRLHLGNRREQLIAVRSDSDLPPKASFGRLRRRNVSGRRTLDVLVDKDPAPVLLLELTTGAGERLRRAVKPGRSSTIELPARGQACIRKARLTDPAGNRRELKGTCRAPRPDRATTPAPASRPKAASTPPG
jgi:hypothetical protein